jgi:hypothetical protein
MNNNDIKDLRYGFFILDIIGLFFNKGYGYF